MIDVFVLFIYLLFFFFLFVITGVLDRLPTMYTNCIEFFLRLSLVSFNAINKRIRARALPFT